MNEFIIKMLVDILKEKKKNLKAGEPDFNRCNGSEMDFRLKQSSRN